MQRWFVATQAGELGPLSSVAGDASFRRYYRASHHNACVNRSVILCDSPPATEKNAEFVAIATALDNAGVRVPKVIAVDLSQGFFALEDLGDSLMLPALDEASVDTLYGDALGMLLKLARADLGDLRLPSYDRDTLLEEMNLFPEWFLHGLLGIVPSAPFEALFANLQTALSDRALAQVQVPVHRDFHARNLMLMADGSIATIDFQDAVVGPVTYDAVSLLRDCYRRWPAARVRQWALAHREALAAADVVVAGEAEFLCDFDWMGLQRHIKVLGIFARLWLRDGKDTYLGDLPRVVAYVREVLAAYPTAPALAQFARYFETELMPQVRLQSWYHEVACEGVVK